MQFITRLGLVSLTVAALFANSTVQAQTVPPSAEAGRLGKEQQRMPLAAQAKSLPAEVSVPTIPVAPNGAPESFIFRSLNINGASRLSKDILKSRLKDNLGKPMYVKDIPLIAEVLTAFYRSEGYILSYANLPQQEVSNGVINVDIREVGVSKVDIIAPPRLKDSLVVGYWQNVLVKETPISQRTLERALISLNRLSGVTAKSVLSPATELNDPFLTITLEQRRMEGFASVDNRGSHYIGPWQTTAAGMVNGVFQPYDRLFVRGVKGTDNQELAGADASYEAVVHHSGTTVQLGWLKSWSEPGGTLKTAKLENVSTRYSVQLNQPIIRQRSENLDVNLELTARESASKTFGSLLSDDKVRAATLGVRYDNADRLGGINLASLNFSQGFDVFGARETGSRRLSRAGGHSDFAKTEASLSRNQRLTDTTSFLLAASGQYAFTQLLAGEEFGFGGSQFGRGYDPSELVGDHGVAGLAELQYRPMLASSSFLTGTEFYTSYDLGSVWAIDTNTRFNRQTAASAAAGVRFNIARLALDLQLAKPLTRQVSSIGGESNNDPRAFISGTLRF